MVGILLCLHPHRHHGLPYISGWVSVTLPTSWEQDVCRNEYGQTIAVILLGFNKVFDSLEKRSGNLIIVFKYARGYYEEGSTQLLSIATKGRTKRNELNV